MQVTYGQNFDFKIKRDNVKYSYEAAPISLLTIEDMYQNSAERSIHAVDG